MAPRERTRSGGARRARHHGAVDPDQDDGRGGGPGRDSVPVTPGQDHEQGPEFGPRGYLPPRAAQRARKIVLREQMGLHWPIAAVVAGLLIVAVTVPLVLRLQGAPGPPSVVVGPLDAIDPSADELVEVDGATVLVVRAGGVLRAFVEPPAEARWCAASRRIEAPDGRIWTAEGRLIAGPGASLDRGQAQAYDGNLYVDPTPLPGLDPIPGDARPGCH
jgi:hypothetical protein